MSSNDSSDSQGSLNLQQLTGPSSGALAVRVFCRIKPLETPPQANQELCIFSATEKPPAQRGRLQGRGARQTDRQLI